MEFRRRSFDGAMAAVPMLGGNDGWVDLFDGKSLDGWRPQQLAAGQSALPTPQVAVEGL